MAFVLFSYCFRSERVKQVNAWYSIYILIFATCTKHISIPKNPWKVFAFIWQCVCVSPCVSYIHVLELQLNAQTRWKCVACVHVDASPLYHNRRQNAVFQIHFLTTNSNKTTDSLKDFQPNKTKNQRENDSTLKSLEPTTVWLIFIHNCTFHSTNASTIQHECNSTAHTHSDYIVIHILFKCFIFGLSFEHRILCMATCANQCALPHSRAVMNFTCALFNKPTQNHWNG